MMISGKLKTVEHFSLSHLYTLGNILLGAHFTLSLFSWYYFDIYIYGWWWL